MTQKEPDKNLEKILHQRLRALPEIPAPKEIIPGVLQKIAAQKERSQVWWKSPWLEWPRGMQALSALLFAAMIGAVFYFHGDLALAASHLGGRLASALSFLKPVWTLVEALLAVLQLLAGSIKSHFLIIAASIIAALYLSAIGIGTLFYRVATDKN